VSREHGLEGMPGGLCTQRGFISALLLSVTALKILERDSDASVRSLAAQTILNLNPRRPWWWTLGRNLRALCCCCC